MLGDPHASHTYTFIDDFADGPITLATRDEALRQVWHVPSAETMTTRQFVETVFEQAGHPPTMRIAPTVAIRALALFIPPLRGVKDALYQTEQPWVVDHSKYARAFGASPTPHTDAIARTLRWFRENAK